MNVFIKTRSKSRDYYVKNFENEEVINEDFESIEKALNLSEYLIDKKVIGIKFNNKFFLYVPKLHRNVDYRGVRFNVLIELNDKKELKGIDVNVLEKLLNENVYEQKVKNQYEFFVNKFDIPFKGDVDFFVCIDKDLKVKQIDDLDKCEKKNYFIKLFLIMILVFLGISLSYKLNVNNKRITDNNKTDVKEKKAENKKQKKLNFYEMIKLIK